MSDPQLEPLPPDVKRLLDLERPLPVASAALAPAVLHALQPKLSAASLAAPATGLATKVVIAALAFGAGAGAMRLADRTVLAPPPPPPPVVVAAPTPAPRPPAVANLSEEQALIDQARAALLRGNANDALAALDTHGQRYPDGQLSEDREALSVQALASLGRDDDAKARATRFREKWPRSILLPVVDAATRKKP
jgi:hypothetical protein